MHGNVILERNWSSTMRRLFPFEKIKNNKLGMTATQEVGWVI